MMAYCLLTGATGLVGRYVLRGLLLADRRVAVLLRRTRMHTARQRLEAVMNHWETLEGRVLTRPVLLEGDLCRPKLGLDACDRKWIAGHCDAVLHGAAAMKFRSDDEGEPARTNVEGVRHVLELCREAGIRKFHHVSTAYVCGLRQGRVLETELDLGQQLGNVYEESKLEGEKLVRAADFFDVLTVYRPASVVGDSRTGHTTSYHGFYLPIQLGAAMANKVPTDEMGERVFKELGLDGSEGKNFVPVDWVAAAIVHLVTHPEHHGKTYHLTSPDPVPVRLIQRVGQEALRTYYRGPRAETVTEAEMAAYMELYQKYMSIYRSHWRNDPTFDRTNSDRALTELPCPEMDRATLMRQAKFAIENGFSVRAEQPPAEAFDVHKHMERFLRKPEHESDFSLQMGSVALSVNGRQGGQWHFLVKDGKLAGVELGLGPDHTPRYYLASDTFAALVRGQATVEQSLRTGRLLIEGSPGPYGDLIVFFRRIVSGVGNESLQPS